MVARMEIYLVVRKVRIMVGQLVISMVDLKVMTKVYE